MEAENFKGDIDDKSDKLYACMLQDRDFHFKKEKN